MFLMAEKFSGLVSVTTADAVKHCNRTLNNIYTWRSTARKNWIQNYLRNSWWNFVPFVKLTRRDAISAYYAQNKYGISASLDVNCVYGKAEAICNAVLAAVDASDQTSILLTPEAIMYCGLEKHESD